MNGPAPWVLGALWAALVLVAARRFPPAPARVRALGSSSADRPPPPARPSPGLAERVGALAWRLSRRDRSRRHVPADPLVARRIGGALLAAAPCFLVLPVAAPAAALVAWALPGVRARRAGQRRVAALAADLPEVVDLLLLAVQAGLNVPLAVAAVARNGSGALAAELARVVEEAGLGRRLADALDDLPGRAGEAVRPLVGALVASERYGAPLGAGLERLADDVRRQRRRAAEEAARRVPVKLLFPLILCILPAFALLTVAPLVASAVRSLRL